MFKFSDCESFEKLKCFDITDYFPQKVENKSWLKDCNFIFVAKLKTSFLDIIHTPTKFNIFHDINKNITVWVPCCVCVNDVATVDIRIILHEKLNIIDRKQTNVDYEKYCIIVDKNNSAIHQSAMIKYDMEVIKLQHLRNDHLAEVALKSIEVEKNTERFETIADDFHNEFDQLLKKYHISLKYDFDGDYQIIFKGKETSRIFNEFIR